MPHDFLAVEPCTDSRKSASLSGGGQHSSAMNGEGTMALKNTTETYGVLAKLLHWLIALMLVGMVIAGLKGRSRAPRLHLAESIRIDRANAQRSAER
jgi:hypothetical protein